MLGISIHNLFGRYCAVILNTLLYCVKLSSEPIPCWKVYANKRCEFSGWPWVIIPVRSVTHIKSIWRYSVGSDLTGTQAPPSKLWLRRACKAECELSISDEADNCALVIWKLSIPIGRYFSRPDKKSGAYKWCLLPLSNKQHIIISLIHKCKVANKLLFIFLC